ncbi:MAG: hypothetical protein METHP_01198 [Methanoregula sp. SKADARSKE-2]|jgi:DnaJ-class molecular chaperone|nr:MAG: hypothetical protein METHP_01198 [Methanoregula sp. SKADARSKE-2]
MRMMNEGADMTDPEKSYEPATCSHCDGEGCLYCNKTGTVLVTAPKTKCPQCEGIGCIYCGFTGWDKPKGKYD